MANEVDQKLVTKLAGIVKKEPGNSERFYSEKSGIPMGQILRYLVLAEIEADPKLKIPATGAAIKKARESGLRWPRIAARAGVSEAKAKSLFEEHTGQNARDSYTGRGRNWSGTASSNGNKSSSSGRRGATGAKPAASGRRSGAAARGSKPAPASRTATRGTRGTRASAKKVADPS
jgi:hypothetical protein